MSADDDVRQIGRYALHRELASGGMAAVHLGRLVGPVGFARTVAIKRLHSHHARDPEFVRMFLDEARLVARIKHPNVVPTLDVVALEGELFLVMEYVHGAPVAKIMMELSRRRQRMPVNVAVGICVGVLDGLHAAHEARSEDGVPLEIVHRDISPQNVIVGTDGIARVLDFGIAKAAERLHQTDDGSFKGKLGYMPPDILSGGPVDRRADLWGVAVVLWEMLVGKRLFPPGDSPHALVRTITEGAIDPPSRRGAETSPALDAVLMRALMKAPEARYSTARAMATALEHAVSVASSRVIGEWLASVVPEHLAGRAALVAQIERTTRATPPSAGRLRSLIEETSEPPASARAAAAPVAAAPAGSAPGASSRRPVLLVLAAVALLLAVAATAIVVAVLRRPSGAMTAPTSSAPLTHGSASPTASLAAPQPSASTSAVAAPPSASSLASAMASAKPPAPRSSPPRSRGSTNDACNPPYTIGPPPDYIRKPKLECLPR